MEKEIKQPFDDEKLIERAFKEDHNNPINYSELGANLLFSHKLRKAVEKLNRSTSILSIFIIFLTIINIILTIVIVLKGK